MFFVTLSARVLPHKCGHHFEAVEADTEKQNGQKSPLPHKEDTVDPVELSIMSSHKIPDNM